MEIWKRSIRVVNSQHTTIAMSEVGSTRAAGTAGAKAEKTEGGEEAINPMKEETYAFIGCLYRLRKIYKLQGFNPDFTKKMFGPYILNKLSRWDGDIQAAVDLWCSDPAAAEEKYGHISKWDVSHVTNMKGLFRWKQRFNEDISAWDVRNVTTMRTMFDGAEAFNQPLADWAVSNVKSMKEMFSYASAFNQPLANWDVSKVQGMREMFNGASAFNQPICNWDVSKVEGMGSMFMNASAFNQPLADWDVSKVKDMGYMFCCASSFNQPLADWDVSKVVEHVHMFTACPILSENKPRRK